jgi:hypothetical protein
MGSKTEQADATLSRWLCRATLPGEETPAGQEIRLAAALSDWLRSPRRLGGFRGPMVWALAAFLLILVVVAVETLI